MGSAAPQVHRRGIYRSDARDRGAVWNMSAEEPWELPDWEFEQWWLNLPLEDRSQLPDGINGRCAERYRNLTPWVGETVERLARLDAKIDAVAATQREIIPAERESNLIDWPALTGQPPPFPWIMEHWLSWHPTLLAGRGGIGKSLLIQQLATALACGLPTWCGAGPPLKVLYWACEDDQDQLHRRQQVICMHHKIGFDQLTNLHIDARYGLENTLMASDYGRPMWTPRIELLRQQLNDLNIDVLALDNIAHTFGANENVRYDVTKFLNGIAGLVEGRPFCPIVLGHPSKSLNSEYSGSTAWENAVRMRWYLDDKLPDQKTNGEDDKPDPDYRVLAKRKTNYTRLDYVQFRFNSGYLEAEPIEGDDPGIIKALRVKRARTIVRSATEKLAGVSVFGQDGIGRGYLPKIILENKLNEGYQKAELAQAMRAMILDGELIKTQIGENSSRHAIFGLKIK